MYAREQTSHQLRLLIRNSACIGNQELNHQLLLLSACLCARCCFWTGPDNDKYFTVVSGESGPHRLGLQCHINGLCTRVYQTRSVVPCSDTSQSLRLRVFFNLKTCIAKNMYRLCGM
uniref:Uncharacterized protein n=1 Tax=Opuntia streptacantha TaxID=393608 RepID=A0A7C8YVN0_OPUST